MNMLRLAYDEYLEAKDRYNKKSDEYVVVSQPESGDVPTEEENPLTEERTRELLDLLDDVKRKLQAYQELLRRTP